MKDNLNIEELFQKTFDDFQADVSPDVWANVQAGIGTGVAATTGVTAAVKIAMISGGIIAASVATWYFGFYEPENTTEVATNTEVINTPEINVPNETNESLILVNDQNDPVILENKETIEKELANNKTVSNNGSSTIDNTKKEVVVNSNNTSGSEVVSNPNNQQVGDKNDKQTGVDAEDKNKPKVPSGRMELSQTNVYAPSTVTFNSNAINSKRVTWDFGDGTEAEGLEAKHIYAKPGKYSVKMKVFGEETSYEESQELVVKTKSGIDNIPNVITPNGDRINDYFSIKSTEISTFFISIRDNKGNEIFNSNDQEFIWDGTDFEGNMVEKGMYTYIIIAEGNDGGVFKLPGQIYVQ